MTALAEMTAYGPPAPTPAQRQTGRLAWTLEQMTEDDTRRWEKRAEERSQYGPDLDEWARAHMDVVRMMGGMVWAQTVAFEEEQEIVYSRAAGQYQSQLRDMARIIPELKARLDGGAVLLEGAQHFNMPHGAYLGHLPDYVYTGRIGRKSAGAVLDRIIRKVEGSAQAETFGVWESHRDNAQMRKVSTIDLLKSLRGLLSLIGNIPRIIEATNSQTAHLTISARPADILSLGHLKCDNGSCYRVDGQCGHAPVVLLHSADTVVYFLREEEDGPIVARAWGNMDDDGAQITNVYCKGDPAIKSLFWGAVQAALGARYGDEDGPDMLCGGAHIVFPGDALYLNNDAKVIGNPDTLEADADNVEGWEETGEECAHCADRHDPEDMTTVASGEMVCEGCLGENYTYIEGDDYYPDDDVVTDYEGNAILLENATELHNGEWASDDDEYLTCSIDGVYFIMDH